MDKLSKETMEKIREMMKEYNAAQIIEDARQAWILMGSPIPFTDFLEAYVDWEDEDDDTYRKGIEDSAMDYDGDPNYIWFDGRYIHKEEFAKMKEEFGDDFWEI